MRRTFPEFAGTWLAVLLLAAPLHAAAQSAKPRPDPADAQAAAPALAHRSALAGYRKHDNGSPPLAWREANDAVERIGGWRAYAREAAAPAPASSAPAAPRR